VSRLEEPTLKVLVVDDEPLACDFAKGLVEELSCVRSVSTCSDGVEAIRAIQKMAPDLVLLDVRMPEVDGFDVIKAVGPDAMPHVIFVTGYEEYSLRAFDVHAVDYVLKPCDPKRLRGAVERAARQIAAEHGSALSERLASLLSELEDSGSGHDEYAQRLTVRDGERFRFVELQDIDWLEASGNYVRLHRGSDDLRVRSTLKGLLLRLDPSRFVRIHRSAVVNLGRVKEVQPWFGGDCLVILNNGEQLRVSRTYREGLLALTH